MRRTSFLALVAALLLVPSVAQAAGPIQIIRDCGDDGALQGNYTASELRNARNELPTDIDEYSDCRDVLSRAIAAKTSSTSDNDGGSQGAGTGNGGGSTSGGDGGASGTTPQPESAATPKPDSSVAVDPGIETGPTNAQDWQAVGEAEKEGNRGVAVNGRDVSPMLVAEVGRNGLPSTLIVALALLGGAVLAACLLPLRRRVTRHRA
jgi:hypothetical protein